jgi:hypothetical protein
MLQLEKVALSLSLASVASCTDRPPPRPAHCATSPTPSPMTIAARTDTPPKAAGCSVFVCGDNAPETGDGFVFDELDVCGAPNYAGVRITGATRPDGSGRRVPVALDVDRHFFFTVDEDRTEHRGSALIDTIISLEHTSGEKFEVRFEAVNDHFNDRAILFQAGDMDPVPTYRLKVRRAGEDMQAERFACNHDLITDDPLWATAPHDALVYRGDRYHPTEKRLLAESDPADGWIFLACAGGAGAKLHLYRHTHAGGIDYDTGREDYPTSLDERTTLAKAITADYCGTGAGVFTERGRPLRFAVNQPWWPATGFSVPGDVSSIEGIWNLSGGLMCLDQPRLVAPGMIPCAPSLGPCGPVQDWPARGYAITANP